MIASSSQLVVGNSQCPFGRLLVNIGECKFWVFTLAHLSHISQLPHTAFLPLRFRFQLVETTRNWKSTENFPLIASVPINSTLDSPTALENWSKISTKRHLTSDCNCIHKQRYFSLSKNTWFLLRSYKLRLPLSPLGDSAIRITRKTTSRKFTRPKGKTKSLSIKLRQAQIRQALLKILRQEATTSLVDTSNLALTLQR